jgi:hypothetical protein
MQKFCFGAILILVAGLSAATAQNRFEGYNILVDAPDTQREAAGACATRYVPTATQITITDLNPATPLKLGSCTSGNFKPVRMLNATTGVVTANDTDFRWCFTGEDKMYRIAFAGDRYTPKLTYNWIATPDERSLGFYNVRDFGAKGDGRTDDTLAIRSAVAYVASRNGGHLIFPDGDYLVGNAPEYPNFKGITLPSGIVVEGAGSNITNSANNNFTGKTNAPNSLGKTATRIRLQGTNRAIFRLGECTERVTIQDLELYSDEDSNTYGIEAVGGFTSSQDFFFNRVVFNHFYRGIYARYLEVNNQQFQFDFVKVENCRFVFNRDAGIWINLWNSDWAIRGTFFTMPPKSATVPANGIYTFHLGAMLIQDTFAGAPTGSRGGDFINTVDGSLLTIIGSECENTTRSLVYGDVQGAGSLSPPLTLINNIFDDPIEIKARRTIVSIGNFYGAKTFTSHPDARIYSTGDRFCYDGYIIGCASGAGPTNFIGGKVIFSTGQPPEGSVSGRPTVFGYDVQFNAPLQVQNVPLNQFPTQNVGNGTFLYCTNCRRNSAPCQAGGNGAPAMFVGGRWECL